MNFHETDPTVRHSIAWFAIICVLAFLLILTSCTICPDHQCPVFPTAAPRQ